MVEDRHSPAAGRVLPAVQRLAGQEVRGGSDHNEYGVDVHIARATWADTKEHLDESEFATLMPSGQSLGCHLRIRVEEIVSDMFYCRQHGEIEDLERILERHSLREFSYI